MGKSRLKRSTLRPLEYPEAAQSDGLIRMFVYGTLRPGHALHGSLAEDVVHHQRATLRGYRLYNVTSSKAPVYPVMVPSPGDTTVGDLLWLTPSGMVDSITRMEVNAGYNLSLVACHPNRAPRTVKAVAFSWPYGTDGWPIKGNDWELAWDSVPAFFNSGA